MPDPLEPVPIGQTGVTTTRLGVGTSHLGGSRETVNPEDAHRVITHAVDAGIRYFDTAPQYAAGESERRLGQALRDVGDDVVVSTKVGRLIRDGQSSVDFSADGIKRSLFESLDRLGLSDVDIALIHDPDQHMDQAVHAAFPALARLRDEGVVRAIGAGMIHAKPLTRFVRETDADVIMCASRYGLMDQSALDDLLPLCHDCGIAMLNASVLHNGLLAHPAPGARFNYTPASAADIQRAQNIHTLCQRHGVNAMNAAVQFAAGHPAISGLVAGPASTAQVDSYLAGMREPIPPALWADLRRAEVIRSDFPR